MATIRQPITLIHDATSTSGSRSLIIGQQSRLHRLSEHGGNWKVIGGGFGGEASTSASAPRFKAARQGDYVAFTNDFDRPKYHILEQVGEDGESIYEFAELATIGLRRARFVWAWRNFIIFANVEMDNRRYAYRLVSSDFDNPTSFDPERADSIAWTKDLMTHEEILGGAPAGNAFLIYTTHGIWEMAIVGGEQVVGFRRVYNGEDNQLRGLLKYPNTLVNLGGTHLYAAGQSEEEGRGALFTFNQFQAAPQRPEWLHRATSLLFDNIDSGACEVHVAGLHGDEVLISVAEEGQENQCPNVTLRINMAYEACDKIDFGFTTFGHHKSQDIQTVRDFIIENRICTLAGLVAVDANYGYENEGLPNPLPSGTAEFEPMSIHTLATIEMGGTVTAATAGTTAANGAYVWNPITLRYEHADGYYLTTSSNGTTRTWNLYDEDAELLYSTTATVEGLWTTIEEGDSPAPTFTLGNDVTQAEDYEQTASDSDSLCALLGSELIDAGCRGCPSDVLFIAAASDDWCLKQIGSVYYREFCTNPEAVGTETDDGYQSASGAYLLNGYESIWIPAPLFVESGGVHAQIFTMQFQAREQASPSEIGLRVGLSGQIVDPNLAGCMVWHQRSLQKLRCQSLKTEDQHKAQNTQPPGPLSWRFEHRAPVLYFEWKVGGTGGDADFSRVVVTAKRYEIKNH